MDLIRAPNFLHFDFSQNNMGSKKYKSLLGGMFLMFVFGSVASVGFLRIYFISFYDGLHEETLFRVADSLLLISSFFMAALSIFSIRIAHMIGIKRLIKVCAIIYSLMIFMTGFTKNFFVFFVLYCIMAPIAAALGTTPLLKEMWDIFPNKMGLISGIYFGMFGMSSTLYGLLARSIINPKNVFPQSRITSDGTNIFYYPDNVNLYIPRSMHFLGIFLLVVACVGIWLFHEKKDCQDQSLRNCELYMPIQESNHEDDDSMDSQTENSSLLEGLKTRESAIMGSCSFFSALYISVFYYDIFNPNLLLDYVFIINVSSTLGKLCFGVLSDCFRIKKLYGILQFSLSILFLTLPLVRDLHDKAFPLWVSGIYFFEGGAFSLLGPAFCKIFEMKLGPELFRVNILSTNLGFLISILLALSESIKNTSNPGYCIFALGLLNLGGSFLTFLLNNEYGYEASMKEFNKGASKRGSKSNMKTIELGK